MQPPELLRLMRESGFVGYKRGVKRRCCPWCGNRFVGGLVPPWSRFIRFIRRLFRKD